MTLLEVNGLRVEIPRRNGSVVPVDDVTFAVGRGEIVGIAGESGSGKSLTLKALVGLTPAAAKVSGDLRLDLDGAGLDRYEPTVMRGRGISMVFQEPMTALNPTQRCGDQIALGLRTSSRLTRSSARAEAIDLLGSLGVPDPRRRARMWPHELSGGQRQRVMIAMALSTGPKLLLCDEPTTALDVSVQDQVLGLLLQIRDDHQLGMVFVSHDLAVLHEICDRLVIMYAGRVMETAQVGSAIARPSHPYTAALLASMPSMAAAAGGLATIGGQPPDPAAFPTGCRFAPRCDHAADVCHVAPYQLVSVGPTSATACVRAGELEMGP